jgi:hypothetical protein
VFSQCPAQSSNDASPSSANFGTCIIIASDHRPSFRHGQEFLSGIPPTPATTGQHPGMITNHHQVTERSHQYLVGALP